MSTDDLQPLRAAHPADCIWHRTGDPEHPLRITIRGIDHHEVLLTPHEANLCERAYDEGAMAAYIEEGQR